MKVIAYFMLAIIPLKFYAQNPSTGIINSVLESQKNYMQQAMQNKMDGSPDPSMKADLFTVSFSYTETTYKNSLGDTYTFETHATGSGTITGGKSDKGVKIVYDAKNLKNETYKLNVTGNYNYGSECKQLGASTNGNGILKSEYLQFNFDYDEETQKGSASFSCSGEGSFESKAGPTGIPCIGGEINDVGGSAENCVKANGGYIITGSGVEETSTQVGNGTETVKTHYTFTVNINTSPIELAAIIKPLSSNKVPYDKWIPEGRLPDEIIKGLPKERKGNNIAFGVELIDKKTNQKITTSDARVIYELKEISRNTGTCLNNPVSGAIEKDDLSFDEDIYKDNALVESYSPTKIITKIKGGLLLGAFIKSKDFAAYGELTASITYEGTTYEAKDEKGNMTVTIPLDENHNKIADAWEKDSSIFSLNRTPEWDDEHVDKNDNNGDGLTVYEEYRGILANGKHIRLSPQYKDLIVASDINDVLKPGLNLLQNAAHIIVTQIKKDELGADQHIVNFNKSIIKLGDQHGILCVLHNFSKDSKDPYDIRDKANTEYAMGFAVAKQFDENGAVLQSPKYCIEYRINAARLNEKTNVLMNIAHEIGHFCGLQHHGGSSILSMKTLKETWNLFTNGIKTAKIIDTKGRVLYEKQCTSLDTTYFKDNDNIDASHTTNESSGDVRCMMVYNQLYTYLYDRTTNYFYLTPYGEYELFHISSNTIPFRFCENVNGTEWNANGKLGGNGQNGNCFAKFRIKDF